MIALLIAAWLCMPAQATWRERPCDPWVLRADLAGHADALVLALAPDLWTAYDGDSGAWLGARRVGSGTLVPETDQPWAGAPVLHPGEGGEAPRWALRRADGGTAEGAGRVVGLRITDGAPHLLHAVAFDDGTTIEVSEKVECWRPGLVRQGRPVSILDRGFEVTGLPEGAELVRWIALGPGAAVVDGEEWPGWEGLPEGAREATTTAAQPIDGHVFTWVFFIDGEPARNGMPQTPREPAVRIVDDGRRWELVGPQAPVGALAIQPHEHVGHGDPDDALLPPFSELNARALEARLRLGAGGSLWTLGPANELEHSALGRLAVGLLDPVVPWGDVSREFLQRGRRSMLLPDDDGDGHPDGWRLFDDDSPPVSSRTEVAVGSDGTPRVMRPLSGDPLAAAASWSAGWPLDHLPREFVDGLFPRITLRAAPAGAHHGVELSLDDDAPFAVTDVRAFRDGLAIGFSDALAPDCGWSARSFSLRGVSGDTPVEAAAVVDDGRVVLLRTGPLPVGEWLIVSLGPPLLDARGRPLATDVVGGRVNAPPDELEPLPPLPTRPATPPPWLSDEERAAGFERLPPEAWRAYRGEDLPEGWRLVDQSLARLGPAGDIVSREVFGDFELRCEWRTAPGGNSGIFFRATETEPAVYQSSPEMQVLDDDAYAGLDARHLSGANYALHAAPPGAVAPLGEWNHVAIRVVGSRVQQWLNGVESADYLLWSPDWEARVAASKFAAWPTYGRAREGHLALQDHGEPVWYRNLRILRL